MAKERKYAVWLELKGKDSASAMFSKAGRGLRTFGGFLASPLKAIDQVGKGFGSFLEKVPGLSIITSKVMELGGALKNLALDTAGYADTLDNLRSATGISAQKIQEVAFAAEHAGVPFEMFQQSLRKMTEVLGRGVKGKELFASLGSGAWSFAKALKAAKEPGEQFELILSQMAAISDPTKRAAFAMRFFSEGGLRLSAAAHGGAAGLKAMREEARRLGIVLSDEDIKSADEFGDTWANLMKTVDATKRDFGLGLIDTLLPEAKELLGNFKDNRKAIGEIVRDLGRDVGGGVLAVARGLKDAFEWSKGAVEWLGGPGLELVGVGLALLAKNPFFAAILAAKAAIEWLIDNTPKPKTEEEIAKERLEAVKKDGVLGGAMATMGAATVGKPGPWGLVTGLTGVGDFVSRSDDILAEDRGVVLKHETRREAEDLALRLTAAMEEVGGSGIAEDQSIEVSVNLNAPPGVVDGAPDVKAPVGTRIKSRQVNTGAMTTSHLKGSR